MDGGQLLGIFQLSSSGVQARTDYPRALRRLPLTRAATPTPVLSTTINDMHRRHVIRLMLRVVHSIHRQ
jgi:hypothetical protein